MANFLYLVGTSEPSPWNSAHRPVVYEFDYKEFNITSVVDNSGSARINISVSAGAIVTGTQVLIYDAGLYNGLHTITSSVGATNFTIDVDYTATTTGKVKILLRPLVHVYTGYASGVPSQPLTLQSTLRPGFNTDYKLRFDISEILKSGFSIVPPPTVSGIDYNLFQRFQIKMETNAGGIESAFFPAYYVVNSSIKTDDLNNQYVDNGAFLTSSGSPILFGCSETIASYIKDGAVYTEVFTDGVVTGEGDFNNDFNNDFN